MDVRDLDFLLASQRLCRKDRAEDDIAEQVQAECEIAAHHLGVDAQAVVPSIGVDVAADGFYLGGDLLAVSGAGAL